MGQNLCWFGPTTAEKLQVKNGPRNPKPKETNSSSDGRFLGLESTIMTLEDHLVLSPALNPHQCIRGVEISVLKQPNKRIYPSSLDADDTHFYTPRLSFSSSGKLEKIDEDEKQVSRKAILCRNGGSSMKKNVSFKLHEEDDHVIIFYSTEETFDSIVEA